MRVVLGDAVDGGGVNAQTAVVESSYFERALQMDAAAFLSQLLDRKRRRQLMAGFMPHEQFWTAYAGAMVVSVFRSAEEYAANRSPAVAAGGTATASAEAAAAAANNISQSTPGSSADSTPVTSSPAAEPVGDTSIVVVVHDLGVLLQPQEQQPLV